MNTKQRYSYRLHLVALLLLAPLTGLAEQATEHAVKAAVAHKIAKFVSWPDGALGSVSVPMRFCVAGSQPMLAALSRLQGHAVRGRAIVVRDIDEPSEVGDRCDVLYVSEEEVREPADWLGEIADQPVLTFSESSRTGANNSMVTMRIDKNKVRFDINLEACEKAGLTIGAQLLQLAAMSARRGR